MRRGGSPGDAGAVLVDPREHSKAAQLIDDRLLAAVAPSLGQHEPLGGRFLASLAGRSWSVTRSAPHDTTLPKGPGWPGPSPRATR